MVEDKVYKAFDEINTGVVKGVGFATAALTFCTCSVVINWCFVKTAATCATRILQPLPKKRAYP